MGFQGRCYDVVLPSEIGILQSRFPLSHLLQSGNGGRGRITYNDDLIILAPQDAIIALVQFNMGGPIARMIMSSVIGPPHSAENHQLGIVMVVAVAEYLHGAVNRAVGSPRTISCGVCRSLLMGRVSQMVWVGSC